MNLPAKEEITLLLRSWRDGDDEAMDQLAPLIYELLKQKAGQFLNQEKGHPSLSATAVVHEAFLELYGSRHKDWKDRNHFLAAAALMMRHFIIRRAIRKKRPKHGGDRVVVFEEMRMMGAGTERELELLGEGLDALTNMDRRKAWVLEIHYFAGLKIEEIASVLGMSASTVKRDLRFTKAWLSNFIKGGSHGA